MKLLELLYHLVSIMLLSLLFVFAWLSITELSIYNILCFILVIIAIKLHDKNYVIIEIDYQKIISKGLKKQFKINK